MLTLTQQDPVSPNTKIILLLLAIEVQDVVKKKVTRLKNTKTLKEKNYENKEYEMCSGNTNTC